ncbi:MAG: HU family DNA-binding protein [Longimicrobiaceae bacterium]
MTKAELVSRVADSIGPSVSKKECAAVVDAFLISVKEALADHENIEIRGFGTFKVRARKSRLARNPRTGDPVEVPPRVVPVFKPSKDLRAMVEEPARV